jgi:hypothetical protein
MGAPTRQRNLKASIPWNKSLAGLQHGKSSKGLQVTITRTTLQPALRSHQTQQLEHFVLFDAPNTTDVILKLSFLLPEYGRY